MRTKLIKRDSAGSPINQAVDYVDHSSELYELPAKVR